MGPVNQRLMRVVGGIVKSDSGKMFLNGRPYHPETPRQAQSEGISIIHQELNLCAEMSVAENIMLGRETQTGALAVDRSSKNERHGHRSSF